MSKPFISVVASDSKRIEPAKLYTVNVNNEHFICPICNKGQVSVNIKNELNKYTCEVCNFEFEESFPQPRC